MVFKVIPLILTISIVFQCHGANSEKIEVETVSGPKQIGKDDVSVGTASYNIQQVTNNIHNVGQIYYFRRKDELIYPNREINGSLYTWSFDNGTTRRHHFHELNNEIFTTVTPLKANENMYIFSSNRSLRLCTKNATDYTLSEPLIHFSDHGFIINSAYCDENGIMFILLIGNTIETEELGKLYKIENKQAIHVKNFDTKPRNFRFNSDDTAMYIVDENGKKIDKYEYDRNTAQLGNSKTVFNMEKYPDLKHHIITSVVPDKDPGHLWVTAAGNEGYVLEINPSTKEIISITILPSKDLTFITFGQKSYKSLFVGSKSTCAKGKAQGSIYSISGMGRKGITDRPINW